MGLTKIEFQPDSTAAVVLGIAQDAGIPHAGCRCWRCRAAFADPRQSQYAAALAVVDTRRTPAGVWLIDATPDIGRQLNFLAPLLGPNPATPGRLRQPDGLFITHAHMGHTSGLVQLGPEAMDVRKLPVYGPPRLLDKLVKNQLWAPLVANLDLRPLNPEETLGLGPGLSLTGVPVPHRDEIDAGTFAYRVDGPERSLLYLPDIDAWDLWPAARQELLRCDLALVDATFYDRGEAGARSLVPHPLLPDTLAFWVGLPTELVLTHFNHTNPVLDEGAPERAIALAAGARLASTGDSFPL
jgi:pyrroloquinoline quinone biosynthesis protein B